MTPSSTLTFTYQGIFIVMTAPGTFVPLDLLGVHRSFVRQELAADQSIWRITSWHKNMRQMQVGEKTSETGCGVYEAARRGGAIIATGHEHSYSRTHLLSSMWRQTVASTDDTLVLSRDDPGTPADEGRSFVCVSGWAATVSAASGAAGRRRLRTAAMGSGRVSMRRQPARTPRARGQPQRPKLTPRGWFLLSADGRHNGRHRLSRGGCDPLKNLTKSRSNGDRTHQGGNCSRYAGEPGVRPGSRIE